MQTFGMTAEPPGADDGGEHARDAFEEFAPRVVEIVGVLIVTEQHGIDGADSIERQRRVRCLGQRHVWQRVVARSVECRIGEQPEAADLDQRRGATDESDMWRGHDLPPFNGGPTSALRSEEYRARPG